MKERLQLACRNIEACSIATLKPASSFESLCADIRLSISIKLQFTQINNNFIMDQQLTYHGNIPKIDEFSTRNEESLQNALYTDRRYHTKNQNYQLKSNNLRYSRTGKTHTKTREKNVLFALKLDVGLLIILH